MARTFMTIRDFIVTKLDALADIQVVYSDPTMDFSSYPAAVVYPSQQESEYQNTVQNERRYAFTVGLFYEMQGTTVGDALDALYELTDQVLDAFDQDPTLTGITLPAGKQMIDIEPTMSSWGQIEGSQILQTNVTVVARVSADIQ